MHRMKLTTATMIAAAVTAVACSNDASTPVSPSAVVAQGSALNADGSNLKISPPIGLSPLFESTNVSPVATLAARASQGRNVANYTVAHRFQVSDNESFSNIVASGTGSSDAQGIVRWTIEPALAAGRRYVWRLRGELEDGYGPWSNVMAFTTAGGNQTTVTQPGPSTSTGPRPADPPPGSRLPLPDMREVLGRFSDARESCPRGLKYVNNPWQDRVIDAFRQVDSRWGYNGKPNRSAADNNGVPVIAAGDEAAYHWGPGPDQGSPDVHLVDMLIGHCGDSPSLTWRVFTGEEPGFWTGAGRF